MWWVPATWLAIPTRPVKLRQSVAHYVALSATHRLQSVADVLHSNRRRNHATGIAGDTRMSITDTATDSKRKVADHALLKADGTETKRMEEAVGIRYTSVEKPDAPFTFMFDGATP